MHLNQSSKSRFSTRRVVSVIFIAVFSVIQLLNILVSIANASPATSYTWKDRQTISVSGGSVKPNQTLTTDPNAAIATSAEGTIQTSEVVQSQSCILGFINCHTVDTTNDCTVALKLAIAPSQAQATISAILIPTYGTPGSAGPCSQATYDEYNNKIVPIGGTRPSDNSSTVEQDSQKTTQIQVNSAMASADAPSSINISVDSVPVSASSHFTVKADKNDSTGNVYYTGTFHLEAGNYQASVNGLTVQPKNFTKVKYTPLNISLGDSEGFAGRQIKVNVNIKTLGGMGATSAGPIDVNLYDSTGKVVNNSKTNVVNIDNTAQSDSRTYYLTATLDNVDAGTYNLCLGSGQSMCQSVVKESNQTKTVNFNVEGQAALDLVRLAGTTTGTLSCGSQVPLVGWIVCPLVSGISTLNDGMWSMVSSLLNVSPINSSDPIHGAWVTIKNLANIAFVITFLIIIFSQLTSLGVTNYGVKKMLPRLIISAILVNVSFLIIQILVDVSNIVGSSLYNVIVSQAPPINASWTDLITLITTSFAGAAVGVASVAIVGGAAAAFWIVLPMAVMAALGLLAALLTLIFRQAVIPVLAILAPLAFVALLMPNTETWFKKWRSMLINLLMLYPTAAVVFGGAQFAAAVIINKNSWWSYLTGMLVMSLPLFSLPFLVKQGGPMLSKVSGSLNGLANKLGKPISGVTSPKRELAEKKYMSASPSSVGRFNIGRRMRLNSLRGKQADKATSSAYDRMLSENTDEDILAGRLDSKLSPETALREKDAASLRQKKRESELIESGAQNIRRTYGSTGTIGAPGVTGGAETAFAEAFAAGDKIKMLSAVSVLTSAGPQGIDKLHSAVLGIDPSHNPELFRSFQNELNTIPGLKSKDASLARLAYTDGGQLGVIEQDQGTYSGLSAADGASQTEASLRRIQATGGMLPSTALSILQNETLSGQLTPATRQIITEISNGGESGAEPAAENNNQ